MGTTWTVCESLAKPGAETVTVAVPVTFSSALHVVGHEGLHRWRRSR